MKKKLRLYLSEAKNFDYIADHFAALPYEYVEKIDAFSIIRIQSKGLSAALIILDFGMTQKILLNLLNIAVFIQ